MWFEGSVPIKLCIVCGAQSFVLSLNRPIPASLPVEIVKQYADNIIFYGSGALNEVRLILAKLAVFLRPYNYNIIPISPGRTHSARWVFGWTFSSAGQV